MIPRIVLLGLVTAFWTVFPLRSVDAADAKTPAAKPASKAASTAKKSANRSTKPARRTGRAAPPSSARTAEIAAMLPDAPGCVGAPITDRKTWDAAAADPDLKYFIQRAEAYLKSPIPELPESLYLDFYQTGNRTRYQNVLGSRHGAFQVLVLAECMENRGRFLPMIERYLDAILSERSWVLPAHDPGHATYDGTAMTIDLASSDTAAQLAVARLWLGDKLSPAVRDRIRDEVERRALKPFEAYFQENGKPHWWLTCTNNWNAVCLAGVTTAAVATIEDRPRRAFFIAAAEKYIRCFLDGFTPDGYCSEGLGYWNYGFGNFMILSETIRRGTQGKVDLWSDPRLLKISLFAKHLEIQAGVSPAFADCSITAKPDPILMTFLARHYGFEWKSPDRASSKRGHSLPYFAVANFSDAPAGSPQPTPNALRNWFDSAGVLICRPAKPDSNTLACALKGGHNDELHNHNDVGSYVVMVGGNAVLLDPGNEVYSARTFSGKRYESKVLSSYGHPVPKIDDVLQRPGRDARAVVLKTEFTDARDTLALDLRSAYSVPDLKTLTRTFVYSRAGSGELSVTDEAAFGQPRKLETALVTLGPWRSIADDVLLVGKGRNTARVKIDAGGKRFRVQAEEIREEMPRNIKPIRLAVQLEEPTTQGVITVTITPEPAAASKPR